MTNGFGRTSVGGKSLHFFAGEVVQAQIAMAGFAIQAMQFKMLLEIAAGE